jgi:hypothetical protein
MNQLPLADPWKHQTWSLSIAAVRSWLSLSRMNKLCILVGTTLGGYAGWAAGDALELGFGWAFVLSGAGSLLGVYAGWKVAQKLSS